MLSKMCKNYSAIQASSTDKTVRAPFKAVPQPPKTTYRFLVGNLTISSHDRWFSNMEDDQLVQRGREPEHLTLALADIIRDLQIAIQKSRDFIIGLRSLVDLYKDRGGEEDDMHYLAESVVALYNLSVSLGFLLSKPAVDSAHAGARLFSDDVSKLPSTIELLSRDVQKLVDQEALSDVTVADKMRAMEDFGFKSTQTYTDQMRLLTSNLSACVMALLAEKI